MKAQDSIHGKDITETLRKRVLDLRAEKPVKILPERELAVQLGVSRMSLRSAIKKLSAEGLLNQKQGSGTYINPINLFDQIHLLIAPDIKTDDPFHTAFMAEMYRVLSKRNISIKFVDHENGLRRRHEKVPLIIIGIVDEALLGSALQSYPHVVSTHSYPDIDRLTQITFDDYAIGYGAARRMIERKLTTLVHLSGPLKYPSPRFRSHGFHDAARTYGVESVEFCGKMNYTCGLELAGEVFDLARSKAAPIGVFASNDWMALGLMHSLIERGVAIPNEVSVIGCDDIPLSIQREPALTTFRWDFSLLTQEIQNELTKMLSSSKYVHKKILLNAQFIERATLVAP